MYDDDYFGAGLDSTGPYGGPAKRPVARPAHPVAATGPEALNLQAKRLFDRADAVAKQAGDLQRKAMELEAKYAAYGDEPPEGCVVRFNKIFREKGPKFSYAATRRADRWFLTQNANSRAPGYGSMSWYQLLDFVAGSKLKVATSWRVLGPSE